MHAQETVRANYHLISQHQNCFQAELPCTEIEQILQTGSEQFHDHNIVVAFSPKPLQQWNARCKITTKLYTQKERGKFQHMQPLICVTVTFNYATKSCTVK